MAYDAPKGSKVSTATGNRRRRAGAGAVIGITLLCLAVTMTVQELMPLEELSIDLRMRWRLKLASRTEHRETSELVLLAIDQATETAFGRYGAGRWLTRAPFLDQLRLFRSYLSPSVLAYDIIFKDTQGHQTQGHRRISELADRTRRIAGELNQLAVEELDCVSDAVLSDLSQLALEQGNVALAHGFAAIWEDKRFAPVFGFNFRGGWDDLQSVEIPSWSDDAAQGGSSSAVPYLKDIAIPAACVRFPSEAARQRYGYAPNANVPAPELLDYAYMGSLNVRRDVDGLVRRVPLVMGFSYRESPEEEPRRVFVPSFALLAVLLHVGVDTFPIPEDIVDVEFGRAITIHAGPETYRIPIDTFGCMRLNYRWQKSDFEAISFAHLAPSHGDTTREERRAIAQRWGGAVQKRIAVVGVTATGIDVGPTPIDANIPLVYVQLTAINNILTRSTLRPVTWAMEQGVMLVLLVAFIGACLAVRGARVVLVALVLLLVYSVVAYAGVHFGVVALPMVAPALFILFSTFGILILRYFTESRARRRIRGMFSTMVSGTVLSYLEDHPESFSLEGHTTDATVLFSDITDFTTLSEHLPPADLIDLLNAYLTPVTDCVLKWGGYLDKYVGDSVMAVWGAPYPDSAHAVKACLSALEHQRIVDRLNDTFEAEYGFRFRVRIGINSGEITAGNVGSERKFQYTVLGDPVNLASRLEPANREFGTGVLIGEATQRLVSQQLETREIGRILVSGREQTVRVYELLGQRGGLTPEVLAVQKGYASALRSFYSRDWGRCIMDLEALLAKAEDGPSAFLLERAKRYRQTPPPAEWKGVYIRAEKN
jgi:adenylate cyclase